MVLNALAAAACGRELPTLPSPVALLRADGSPATLEPDVRYVASRDLRLKVGVAPGASWPALRLSARGSAARVARLAAALGVSGRVTSTDSEWRVSDGSRDLVVKRSGGLEFELLESQTGVPPRNSNLLTPESAARVARRALVLGANVDLRDVEPKIRGGYASWHVEFDGVFRDGLRADGFTHSVTVAGRGEIVSARGYLGRPYDIGVFPLSDVDDAVARVTPQGTRAVEVWSGRIRSVLVKDATGDVLIVPMYAVGNEETSLFIPAVRDEFLGGRKGATVVRFGPRPDETAPLTRCALAAPEPTSDPANRPLVAEVCVDHARARVGQRVVFKVTGSDVDVGFATNHCYGGPFTVRFGDEQPEYGRMCAGPGSSVTPAREFTSTLSHAYPTTGRFTARFTIRSGSSELEKLPGASVAVATVAIDVAN